MLYPANVDGKEGLVDFINSHPSLSTILQMDSATNGATTIYTLRNLDSINHRIRLIWIDKQGHPTGGVGSITGEFSNPTIFGDFTDEVWKDCVCLALASVVIPAPTEPERVDGGDLNGTEAVITFDEFDTVNPSYVRSTILLGAITVTTGQHFIGQNLESLSGSVYTLGGTPTPNQPLTLSSDGQVRIEDDGANSTSPVLSGDPRFDAPISVRFSKDVNFITIDGGHFNTANSVTIQAFDAQGNIVHQVTNSKEGIETFGISAGATKIRGFSFFITGNEPGGFALDNLKFR